MIDLKKFLHVDENSEANKLLCKHFRTEHHYSDGERVGFDSDTNKYYKYINGNREYLSSVYHKLETRRVVTIWSILSRVFAIIFVAFGVFMVLLNVIKYKILLYENVYRCIDIMTDVPTQIVNFLIYVKNDEVLSSIVILCLCLVVFVVGKRLADILDTIEITECRINKEKRDGDSNENP